MRLALVPMLAALASALGCRPDCATSADIQVTVAADTHVDVRTVASLHVSLSIDGAMFKQNVITVSHTLAPGQAFLLHPDPPPASRYNVALTVMAFNDSNALVAVGSTMGDVSSNGCNRLEVYLASLGGGGDDGGSGDGGACIGATPDEDSDGRGDVCDRCPADFDPVPSDADGDGLPDACDPDNGPPNRLVYFEPFNDTGHWSGVRTAAPSTVTLSSTTSTELAAINPTDMLPVGLRAQLKFSIPRIYATSDYDGGLYLITRSDPHDANADGALCVLQHGPSSGDMLVLAGWTNGASTGITSFTPTPIVVGNEYRLRLTQRGASYYCEIATNGRTYNVSFFGPSTPVGPQYLAMRARGLQLQAESIVAETASDSVN